MQVGVYRHTLCIYSHIYTCVHMYMYIIIILTCMYIFVFTHIYVYKSYDVYVHKHMITYGSKGLRVTHALLASVQTNMIYNTRELDDARGACEKRY